MASRQKTIGAFLVAALLAGISAVVLAEQASTEDGLREKLRLSIPHLPVDAIRPTPVAGLYEVVLGQRIVYVSGDGRYLLQGSLLDLERREDLTEPRLNAIKAAALAKVGEQRMVIFGPEDARHTVTVFTDIDCGYCRKLHAEMAQYNEKGIRIRYLFYPRAGIGSPSYTKAVSVWCAEDRNQAMTDAKAGKALPEKDCDNPVAEHYQLGERMGVNGTPALVLEDGSMVPGYVPAARLAAMLAQAAAE